MKRNRPEEGRAEEAGERARCESRNRDLTLIRPNTPGPDLSRPAQELSRPGSILARTVRPAPGAGWAGAFSPSRAPSLSLLTRAPLLLRSLLLLGKDARFRRLHFLSPPWARAPGSARSKQPGARGRAHREAVLKPKLAQD
jgi:hypothetical protein